MFKWNKILRNILFSLIIVTLIVHLFPNISVVISKTVKLTDEQLSNFLTLMDILLSTVIALYSLMDQKLMEKSCIYDFSIENDNLSLEAYRRFPSEIENSYSYVYRRENDDIDSPYYGMEVRLERNALRSVGIPLCMKVSTGLNGESIEFSNLRVYIRKRKKVIKSKKLSQGIRIEKPIQNGKKFLIRIQLLCNQQLEKKILDSRIYLSFVLILHDDRGRTYKKYIFLVVQNIMGETKLLSITSRNNWISYIVKLLKLNYRLCKKR